MTPSSRPSTATANGQQIAHRRTGSGPPVLLVHGIPTCSRLWDEAADDLAADFDVIAVDLLGYGASAKPLDRDVPAHVVWGENDEFQKPEYVPRLRDAIPGATLQMVDGHFLPWDRTKEVAAELRSLLGRATR